MFNKLKSKLSGFKEKIGSKIDEKAVAIDPVGETVVSPAEVPAESLKMEESPATSTPSSQEEAELVAPVEENEPMQKGEVKEESKVSRKFGFAQKAKALVFEREFILEEEDLEEPLWDLEMALLESDIALSVSEAIVSSVKSQLVGTRRRIGSNTGNIVEEALKNAIYDVMSANVFDLDEYVRDADKPVHIVFIGINGTGKTTSIAKLSKRFKDQGMSVVVAAGDTFRAGAIDQLAIHADKIGVKIIKHQEQGDPAAVIYDAIQHAKAHNVDVVLSDTAGRMHTNINLMEQLKKVCRVAPPDLIIFVDEAVAGNDAVERADQFNAAVPINGSILTKTDADSKGGAAISIAYITGKPILFLGMGQGYDDLRKFDPQWFVDQLFAE